MWTNITTASRLSIVSIKMNEAVASALNTHSLGRSVWLRWLQRDYDVAGIDNMTPPVAYMWFYAPFSALVKFSANYNYPEIMTRMENTNNTSIHIPTGAIIKPIPGVKLVTIDDLQYLIDSNHQNIAWRMMNEVWSSAYYLVTRNDFEMNAWKMVDYSEVTPQQVLRVTTVVESEIESSSITNTKKAMLLTTYSKLVQHPLMDVSSALVRAVSNTRKSVELVNIILNALETDSSGYKVGIDAKNGAILSASIGNGKVTALILSAGADPNINNHEAFRLAALRNYTINSAKLIAQSPRFTPARVTRAWVKKLPTEARLVIEQLITARKVIVT